MQFEPVNPHYEARARDSFARQSFMGAIGAELVDMGPGAATVRLPHRVDLAQQHGFFHGGVIGTLVDNASAYAAYSQLPVENSILTVEYKVNLLAPARGEALEAEGRLVRAGRSLIVGNSEVFALRDGKRHLCATGVVTLMNLANRADH